MPHNIESKRDEKMKASFDDYQLTFNYMPRVFLHSVYFVMEVGGMWMFSLLRVDLK